MNRLATNGHANGKLRFSAQDWIGPQHGDRNGTYWQSRKTGEKVYSPTNPGGQENQGEQPQQLGQQAKIDFKAMGQKYAQQAREKWGDKAHENLTKIASNLEKDESPEAKRKLEAVKAMLQAVQSDATPEPDSGESQAEKLPEAGGNKSGNVSSADQIPGGKADAIPESKPKKPKKKENIPAKISMQDNDALTKAIHESGSKLFSAMGYEPSFEGPTAHKVPISDLYDAVKNNLEGDVTLTEFKDKVAKMIQSGHLEGSRQDLVAGTDRVDQGYSWQTIREKVADSEISHPVAKDAKFHNIIIPKPEAKPKKPKKPFVDKEGVGRTREDYDKAKSDGRIPGDLDFGTFQKSKMPLPPAGTHSEQKQRKEPTKDLHSAASDIGVKIYTPKDGGFKDQLYDIGRVDTKYLDDNYDALGLHHNESLRYLGQVYNNAKDAGLSKDQVQKKIDGAKKVINDTANAIRDKGASLGIENADKVADFYATHGIAMANQAQEELLGKPRQSSMDYDGDEPQRYEAISLDDLRRMPGPEATAYAKGVLAMLQRRPDLRKEFSLQDIAYLEMIARDVDRYAADEPELEWDDPFEHVPNKD